MSERHWLTRDDFEKARANTRAIETSHVVYWETQKEGGRNKETSYCNICDAKLSFTKPGNPRLHWLPNRALRMFPRLVMLTRWTFTKIWSAAPPSWSTCHCFASVCTFLEQNHLRIFWNSVRLEFCFAPFSVDGFLWITIHFPLSHGKFCFSHKPHGIIAIFAFSLSTAC